jgi:hypothetical protein
VDLCRKNQSNRALGDKSSPVHRSTYSIQACPHRERCACSRPCTP